MIFWKKEKWSKGEIVFFLDVVEVWSWAAFVILKMARLQRQKKKWG